MNEYQAVSQLDRQNEELYIDFSEALIDRDYNLAEKIAGKMITQGADRKWLHNQIEKSKNEFAVENEDWDRVAEMMTEEREELLLTNYY